MRTRAIHLLLASIACWGSGAARFLHELTEHADSMDWSQSGSASSHEKEREQGPSPEHHHDRDDCPTCQMLAHMSATGSMPAPMLCRHLPSFSIIFVGDWVPAVQQEHHSVPIRGPPGQMGARA